MSQWGQGPPPFQYPMQTAQFQQGFAIGNPGLVPQPTGFVDHRPQAFQQPGFLQAQPTGFPPSSFQQQARQAPPPPPVPPLPPSQNMSFLGAPPPQPSSRYLTSSPGLTPQFTGFPGRTNAPLVPQFTGFVDPRLQLMSNTFMPMNASAAGIPMLAPQQQNLQQSFQQHNQEQLGTTSNEQMSWALSKSEKKFYDNVFRAWDAQGTGFISGETALDVFGNSGLPKDDLARIWGLADKDNRGQLNIAEFHVAMGLIYRKLNGMPIPNQLPPELVPPSARDLDSSVDLLKDLLKNESRSRSPSTLDVSVSRLKSRSFNSSSPSLESGRDATIYKHNDDEPPGGFYQPRSRHINRDDVRSKNEEGTSADLSDMKRKLANAAQMLDRAADAEASRTAEDEELQREMDDLKYRVKRVSDDLEYLSRGPRSAAKDEEKRRLERELLSLMHERIPELERRMKARDERKEREKRQWARDRDRANERFNRYDPKDDDYSSRRYGDRDRPYSRGAYDRDDRRDDRDSKHRSNDYDRKDYDRTPSRRERSRSRSRSHEREREPPRSPRSARSPPPAPAPPRSSTPSAIRDSHTVVPPRSSPSPAPSKMTAEERQAYAKAEARRRIEARMAALGVTTPTTSPSIDTSVEDRLQQEKKEAEEKARAAEKQAEERERLRRERLENEKALKEGKTTTATSPAAPVAPSVAASVPPPLPASVPRAVPTPPKPKAPAPPPPRRLPATSSRPTFSAAPTPPVPIPSVAPPVTQSTWSPIPSTPDVDHEEAELRKREEVLRKQKEARAERLRQLEREEAEASRREEEEYQARLQALKAKATTQATPTVPASQLEPASTVITAPASIPRPPTPPSVPVTQSADVPPVPSSNTGATPLFEKKTNPFSRFMSPKDVDKAASVVSSTNPWAQSMSSTTTNTPVPPKNPFPAAKPYNTAPSSDIDDWDEIKENEADEDSSDDEIVKSRATRANIAQQLFGSMLPRPTSGAGTSGSTPVSSPATPAPMTSISAPTPPPAPSAPIPPPPPPPPAASSGTTASSGPRDVSALMQSIQGGMKLRPTKTVDKSGPQVSGRVLGDIVPPPHIVAASPVLAPEVDRLPEPVSMSADPKLNNRQSVDWFANRAVDAGLPVVPPSIELLPPMAEEEERDERPSVPFIRVEEVAPLEASNDLMADIDRTIEHRVRSLYPFEGDGPDDLSFGDNLIIVAHPSRSGGDWWHGTLVSTGKSGLFPKTFVEVVKPISAKALYSYAGANSDELSFNEGDTLSIIDRTEEEWWKTERDGAVYIVPATYLEVVEVADKDTPFATRVVRLAQEPKLSSIDGQSDNGQSGSNGDAISDDSNSDYISFESEHEDDPADAKVEREARERERQLVLEAAGLIVNQDVKPPPGLVRSRSKGHKRRPAPAVPRRNSLVSGRESMSKDLPPIPEPEPVMDHATRLEDAFDRYESFRNQQLSKNRLSLVSTDSLPISSPASVLSANSTPPAPKDNEVQGKYAQLLQFLSGRSRTPESDRRISTLSISGPIGNASLDISRSGSPAFGTSWASLVDESALEGMPGNERKRQEAIFELIVTEAAYVRDLQLIVEVFYGSMMPILSTKETTVVFANIEDILLTNTAFLSSLEDRQKECRLYIDKIGDTLKTHLPNMGMYMQYCVNHATAIKVLHSLREANQELASHLQALREDPAVRNLDLSSYLLAPMQRVTKYPLLIKQILNYTEAEGEQAAIRECLQISESLLDNINEAIRDQEGREKLKLLSRNLWIGSGRLDLTAPTRHMGPRKLLKEGPLIKAKSGRRLCGLLCSDIFVLTDASMKTLYRLPIPLAHSQALEISTNKDELSFQIKQAYPRGGDTIMLKATPIKEGYAWIEEFNNAGRRCRRAEERALRKAREY
ncbi:hypothetical protein AMATHDRAFT_73354 [Amanita thiersii Skay4041]|uniref:Actin cytoskeleton-regulatory complex protein PAN1 n=1 Tax=Amanita thiersii Skay4041 TaxID=703135 RepID=A0A2A9NSN3_9AGAR|nr:hypothetical protein AMATHDRAFT_73354 [Amanita thiersii Skay4041]